MHKRLTICVERNREHNFRGVIASSVKQLLFDVSHLMSVLQKLGGVIKSFHIN